MNSRLNQHLNFSKLSNFSLSFKTLKQRLRISFSLLISLSCLSLLAILNGCGASDCNTCDYTNSICAGCGAKGYTPLLKEVTCPFTFPSGQQLKCASLTVPENRAHTTGKTIDLTVAIFKSYNPKPQKDPVIYLEGGPGGSVLRELSYAYLQDIYALSYSLPALSNILQDRDLIILDQRGTGYSSPTLDCPEQYHSEFFPPNWYDYCFYRLQEQQKINLASYTSAENAADVEDLRLALGLKKVNLYGISYGSKLALSVLRDFPEGLRSVIIDGVFPPTADLYADSSLSAHDAFSKLFQACAADSLCNATYPDLENTFFTLVDSLNTNPLVITSSTTGASISLTGDDLISLIFNSLYNSSSYPKLPGIIYKIKNHDATFLKQLLNSVGANLPEISIGMNYAVLCNEVAPFSSLPLLEQRTQDYPEYALFGANSLNDLGICNTRYLKASPPAKEHQAVKSNVPTLLFSGGLDPITPPNYAVEAQKTLSNSALFPFKNTGHGTSMTNACALDIMGQFLNNPKPSQLNGQCLNSEKKIDFATAIANSLGYQRSMQALNDDLETTIPTPVIYPPQIYLNLRKLANTFK